MTCLYHRLISSLSEETNKKIRLKCNCFKCNNVFQFTLLENMFSQYLSVICAKTGNSYDKWMLSFVQPSSKIEFLDFISTIYILMFTAASNPSLHSIVFSVSQVISVQFVFFGITFMFE